MSLSKRRYHSRTEILTAAAILCLCLLTGCGKEWKYEPITNVNDLEGRRVGVNLSWAEDYYLLDREDLELFEYDSTADMILALNYDKIDAIALDDAMWALMDSVSDGVEKVEPAIGNTGYVIYIGGGQKELLEDFNSFLAQYKETVEYQDYLERIKNFDGEYAGPEIPLTGTGKVLKVAFPANGYPRSFQEPGCDPVGFDLEAVEHYANDRDLRIQFYAASYDDAIIGLQTGTYDIYAGYLSDEYKKDATHVGMLVSDPIYTAPLYFVQKVQPEITVQVEELE